MRVKKLLGVCLCVFVCVHVLMRVPVCKKLKCAHENKHEILVKRTCVASLLGTRNDLYTNRKHRLGRLQTTTA